MVCPPPTSTGSTSFCSDTLVGGRPVEMEKGKDGSRRRDVMDQKDRLKRQEWVRSRWRRRWRRRGGSPRLAAEAWMGASGLIDAPMHTDSGRPSAMKHKHGRTSGLHPSPTSPGPHTFFLLHLLILPLPGYQRLYRASVGTIHLHAVAEERLTLPMPFPTTTPPSYSTSSLSAAQLKQNKK